MVSEVNTSPRAGPSGQASVSPSGTGAVSPGQAAAGQAPADPRLYLRDEELDRGLGLIFAGERALMSAVADMLAESDLPAGEWQILLMVHFRPGCDVSTLRDELGATVPTFARLLGRLDARGLVAKARSGRDGRRRVLSLSAEGERLVAPVAGRLRDRLRDAYRSAGPEAVAGARGVLEALAQGRDQERGVGAQPGDTRESGGG